MLKTNPVRQSLMLDWHKTRESALMAAYVNGLTLQHRPMRLKFEDDKAVVYPDIVTEPHSGISVGDEVAIVEVWDSFAPWALDPHQVSGAHGGTVYQVLSFASLKSSNGKGSLVGTFAILAEKRTRAYGEVNFTVCQNKHGKVYLYWVGNLQQIT